MNLMLSIVLVKIGWIDFHKKIIPNQWIGILSLLILVKMWLEMKGIAMSQILGIFSVSVPLLVIAVFAWGSFGGGDIKLLAASGLLLGAKWNIYAFGIGILIAGCEILVKVVRKDFVRNEELALGPALCTGIFLMLWWGEKIEVLIG